MSLEQKKKINVRFHKKQRQALNVLRDKKTTELLYGGGAGGGKSFLGCYWLITSAIRYPGTRWLVGRSILKTLKATTMKTFWSVVKMLGLKEGTHYRLVASGSEVKFVNGSEVVLKDLFDYPSDPEWDELGSLELTGAFIDECAQVTEEAKEIVRTRIRYKLKENDLVPKLLMSCNPSKNWTYKVFYKGAEEGTLPERQRFIQALVVDNPFIDESYVENLRTLKFESKKQRLLYGNWDYDDDPDRLFDYDDIMDAFNIELEQPIKLNYMTCDIALKGSDLFVIGIWEGWALKKIYSHEKTSGKEVEEIIRKYMKIHRVRVSNVVYDSDGVGGFLGSYLRGSKAFVNGAKPVKVKGEEQNYENLKTQCYYRLSDSIKEGKISIDCDSDVEDLIIEELQAHKQRDSDKDGKLKITKKEVIKKSIGRSPDYADMIMMREYFDLPKKNSPQIL